MYVDGASEEQKYEGEWVDDQMQGRGTFTYASGAKYEVRQAIDEWCKSSTSREAMGGSCLTSVAPLFR